MCQCEFLYRFEERIVSSYFLLFTSILILSSFDQLQLVLSKAILNILYKFNCCHEFFKNRHTKMIVWLCSPDKSSQPFVIKIEIDTIMLGEPQQATERRNGEKHKISCFALDSKLSPQRRNKTGWIKIYISVLVLSQLGSRDNWRHKVISSTRFSPSKTQLTVSINPSPPKPVIAQGLTLSNSSHTLLVTKDRGFSTTRETTHQYLI